MSRLRRAVADFHEGRLAPARRRLLAVAAAASGDAAWACLQLVHLHLQHGTGGDALRLLRADRGLDPSIRALGLGCLLRRLGRPAEAQRWLTAARAGAGGDAAAIELAGLAARAGRAGDGERLARAAELRLRRRGDTWGIAAALAQRAALAVAAGRLEAAIELAREAGRLRRRCGDLLGLGYAAQLEAKALYHLTRYGEAFAALEGALAIHDGAAHLQEAGVVLNNLGLWHLDLSDPVQAVERFRAARARLRRVGDRPRQAAVAANLGIAYRQLGELGRAAACFARALRLLPASEGDARGVALAELAETESRRGRAAAALRLLEREARAVAASSPGTRGLVGIERARARLLLGQPAAAAAEVQAARRQVRRLPADERNRLACELKGGILLARAGLATGHRPQAARALHRVERKLEALLARQDTAWVRMGLLDAYRETHDWQVRALLDRPAGGHRSPRRAWRAAAGFKARELRLRLAPGAAADWHHPDITLLEYHVGAETTWLFVARGDRLQAVDLGVGERDLAAAVAALLQPLRGAGASSDPRPHLLAFDLHAAEQLHALLLAPALAALSGPWRRLVIVPDGPLHALPFELLVGAGGARGGAASAAAPLAAHAGAGYVLDQADLSYAYSSRLLARAEPGPPPRSLLAFSHSPRPGSQLWTADGPLALAPLPHAFEETAAIARFFPRATLRAGAAARPAAYRRLAPGQDVIHLAAHARADARVPGLSGIVLAGDQPGALGYLDAAAIARVPLTASLVTLSACDTGRGPLRAREGVLGLARSFLEAGAEAVVATLWPVDDAAALTLMQSFYRRLAAGEERAAALAGAKRELRAACGPHLLPPRAHPYFWAAFVLLDHRPGAGGAGRAAGSPLAPAG